MGIMDVLSKEDRVEVTFSTFYGLMKECATQELLVNAVNCDIPHKYIREMITGKKEGVKIMPVISKRMMADVFKAILAEKSEGDENDDNQGTKGT